LPSDLEADLLRRLHASTRQTAVQPRWRVLGTCASKEELRKLLGLC
jgi:hypothetical protein